MALIKILILDDDDEYSFNLCNFLTHNYSETLLVNYCNNAYSIEEWIKKIDPDILLTCEDYYHQVQNHFHKKIIILTSGKSRIELNNSVSIYKYRDANKIAGDIINNFISAGNTIITLKDKNTKIIPVYSATGNVGKTSIAYGISTICSISGLTVFYLNLEQFQSACFSGNSEYSLSDIIFYAKDRDKNLVSKMTNIRCQDPLSNVYFFREANNAFDLNELFPDDIEYIIKSFKECAQYDLIIVDMDSQFNKNSMKIFEMADEILYVLTDEEICLHKSKLFVDSMTILSTTFQNTFFAHKFLYVANKVSNQPPQVFKQFQFNNLLSIIPYYSEFISLKPHIYQSGGAEIINNPLKEIAKRYIV